LLVSQGLSQRDRLVQLNNVAIVQMKSLVGNSSILGLNKTDK